MTVHLPISRAEPYAEAQAVAIYESGRLSLPIFQDPAGSVDGTQLFPACHFLRSKPRAANTLPVSANVDEASGTAPPGSLAAY
jgi:hypothetical protein